eukprot:617312-Prorocentrum_minimum.AAC.1
MTDQSDTGSAGMFSRRTNQTSTHRRAVHGGHVETVRAFTLQLGNHKRHAGVEIEGHVVAILPAEPV